MGTEADYQRAITELQACATAVEQTWTFVTGDWGGMTDFAGPIRDDLNKRFTEFGEWYANAKAGLAHAIEEAEERKAGCHNYSVRVHLYNTGQRPYPPRCPWYCDPLKISPPPSGPYR